MTARAEPLHVVAAVLYDAQGRVLLAQRPAGKAEAGLWEFPGGKCEAGETAHQALRRELREELGIELPPGEAAATPLIRVPVAATLTATGPAPEADASAGTGLRLRLDTWRVHTFLGRPEAREHSALAWVEPADLARYPMPAADRPVLAALRGPERLLLTPEPDAIAGNATDSASETRFIAAVETALRAGLRRIHLRIADARPGLRARLAAAIAPRLGLDATQAREAAEAALKAALHHLGVQEASPHPSLSEAERLGYHLLHAAVEDFPSPAALQSDPPKPVKIVADRTVANMSDFVSGANEIDFHIQGIDWGRDLPEPDIVADIRNVVAGDPSPDGKGTLAIQRGIEVGHVFFLGTKYSKSMNCTYLDENGKPRLMVMGCYGIGVTRLVGAAIEQNHDDKGIIWPDAIAPFTAVICPVGWSKSEAVRQAALDLHEKVIAAGIDVILDDRDERPGVMFADWELIGVPHRITIGDRGLKEGMVEYQHRRDAAATKVPLAGIAALARQKACV